MAAPGRTGPAAPFPARVGDDETAQSDYDKLRRRVLWTMPSGLYVLGSRPAANAVVVGPRESLARRTVEARGRLHADVERVGAKLRYRSPAVGATVEKTANGFRLVLDEPAYGVAPGQAAVLYDGDLVVGQGTITSAQ